MKKSALINTGVKQAAQKGAKRGLINNPSAGKAKRNFKSTSVISTGVGSPKKKLGKF